MITKIIIYLTLLTITLAAQATITKNISDNSCTGTLDAAAADITS